MKVKDLISELQKIENQDAEIIIYDGEKPDHYISIGGPFKNGKWDYELV